ncbi:2204_t:CDS:2, partial [Cetraspora pellucida]
ANKTDKEQPFSQEQIKDNIMKLVRQMKPTLLLSVENKCKEFKESENKILFIVSEIFNTMKDVWNNSALNFEVAGAILERESIASADRKGDGQVGKRPDIMFMVKHLDAFFEIMYVECSRLVCTPQKKVNDDIKLWSECNDGMYYTRKTLHPDKDQFGIVGIQIAEDTLYLNVLIRDKLNIDRYYKIELAKILVQKSDETIVIKFVETLLILCNIIITNLSLLYHA